MKLILLSLLAVYFPLLNLAAVGQDAALYFPPAEGQWQTIDPDKIGWDTAKLKEALEYAGNNKSSGVVILYRGRILAEQYWPLSPPEKKPNGGPNPYFHLRLGKDDRGRAIEDVASVQKSVTAILVGIAQHKGLLKIDDPVHKHLGKGWSKAPSAAEEKITIRHLITMTSGLNARLENEAPAGSKWAYNTAAYSRALTCVSKVAKMDPTEVTKKWLTDPIGMQDSRWAMRPWLAKRPDVNKFGFATTARDLARFGLLMLANGNWDGNDVIEDKDFIKAATSPSQKLNLSYGFLWWLNGKRSGRMISAAPRDMYAAKGALMRRLFVLPSQQLVIVRLGDQPAKDFDTEFFKRLKTAFSAPAANRQTWLKSTGYGLMFHYECFKNHNAIDYNKAVDSFDVETFGDAVESTNAGHVIFVIGQHWGKYCAPNSAYEKLLGVENGEWTSRRDLIMEIARALDKRKIRLIIYMTARAPMRHYRVIAATGDTLPTINGKPAGPGVDTMSHPRKVKGFKRSENQPPTPVFLKNWGDVCGEWSRRYGKLVSGWWFDGYKMEMKDAYEALQKEEHNIDTWIDAIRSGNPDAELAFNAGAHPILSLCTRGKLCPHQTFTSGEQHDFTFKSKPLTPKNFPAPDGVVWHLLVPVSDGWGTGTKARFEVETLTERIDEINSQGGAVTLDTPITADGKIPSGVLATLRQLGKHSKELRDGVKSTGAN